MHATIRRFGVSTLTWRFGRLAVCGWEGAVAVGFSCSGLGADLPVVVGSGFSSVSITATGAIGSETPFARNELPYVSTVPGGGL